MTIWPLLEVVTAIAGSLAETSAAVAEAIPLDLVAHTLSGSDWMAIGLVDTLKGEDNSGGQL